MSDEEKRAAAIAREWREVRGMLLEFAEQLPETRLGQATERAGWTIRHELAHFALLDRDVIHLFERAAAGASEVIDEARESIDLRRMRGQAMHAAQDLRLSALREHLAAAGERAAATIEAQAAFLGHPVRLVGREATTVAGHLEQALARAREGVGIVRDALK